eukprot:4341521-Karenia_brevis.AAC.1
MHQKVASSNPKKPNFAKPNSSNLKVMLFDMRDYCDDCLKLYTDLTGVDKYKHATTPFLSDSLISADDDKVKGELGVHACRCLMKALWLGRLARPDICKAINDLTTKVQNWSRNDDKKLFRIFCYLHSSRDYLLAGHVGDSPD